MAQTSITRWSKTVRAGGIGSMRQGDSTLVGLEAEAQEAQRGLWANPHPVPP